MARAIATLVLAAKAGFALGGLEGAALAFHLAVISVHLVGAGIRDARRRAGLAPVRR